MDFIVSSALWRMDFAYGFFWVAFADAWDIDFLTEFSKHDVGYGFFAFGVAF